MNKIIDIHAHFGSPDGFPQSLLEKEMYKMSLEELKSNYRQQGIHAACISPMEGIFPSSEQMLLKANQWMGELAASHSWIYQWAVVNPWMPKSYKQAEEMLKQPKCVGVKIHPDAHGYPIRDCAEEIFSFCRENKAVLLSHSGEKNSSPADYLPFADAYPEVKLVLAHLGCGYNGDISGQVQAIKQVRHNNIYTDVSSARSIVVHLIEWAVKETGAEKLLFGTDVPLHHIGMMKARIVYAQIQEEEKEKIFYQNAKALLPLP